MTSEAQVVPTDAPNQDVVDAPEVAKQFLVDLFGEDWKRVAVCDVQGDPNSTRNWQIAFAERGLRRCVATTNNYYSVSVLKEPRRVRSAFEKTRVLVFDDVGSKVPEFELACLLGEPRWKVETSPGNFQWVYALTEWITDPLVYEGLMRSFAAKGLTDPGTIDRVRLMRLPTGINGKPKYDNPITGEPARVHGERDGGSGRWRLGEVLKLLGLDEDGARSVGLKHAGDPSRDDGIVQGWAVAGAHDPLLELMTDMGMVLGSSPKPGVLDIRCPWAHEHTSRELSGTAYFGRGLFKCQHGHCVDRDSRAFKAEILDQAGQVLGGGVKSGRAIMAEKVFADDAGGVDEGEISGLVRLVEAQGKPWGRVISGWVYAREQDRFVSLDTGEMLNNVGFEAYCAEIGAIPAGVIRSKSSPVRFKNEGTQVAAATYIPGEGQMIMDADGRGKLLNVWRPPVVVGAGLPGSVGDPDVKVWLDHLEYLFPDGRERAVLLDMMSFVLQRPGEKINWATVIVGENQGTGKDTLFAPLWLGVGQRNMSVINPGDLASEFNSWLMTQVVVVEELSAFDKREMYDRIKPLLAAPPDTVTIKRKYMPPMVVPNRQVWVFFTNHDDALALEATDRRFWPIITHAAPQGADYYRGLWSWYRGGGMAKVVRWLKDRVVLAEGAPGWSGFSASVCPPDFSGAKAHMSRAGATVAVRWVLDLFEPGGPLEGRKVVGVGEISKMMGQVVTPLAVAKSLTDKQVGAALRMMGGEPLVLSGTDPMSRNRNLVRLTNGLRARLWSTGPGLAKMFSTTGVDQMRAVVEKEMGETKSRLARLSGIGDD